MWDLRIFGAMLLFFIWEVIREVRATQARLDAINERFEYDWTKMSTLLRIRAFDEEGAPSIRSEQLMPALSAAITVPAIGDLLVFEHFGRTHRGRVQARQIEYAETNSQVSRTHTTKRLHMLVDVDVVLQEDFDLVWHASARLDMDEAADRSGEPRVEG